MHHHAIPSFFTSVSHAALTWLTTLKGHERKNMKSSWIERLGFYYNEFVICSEERAFVSDKMMKTENQSGATCCGLWYLSSDVSTGRFTNSTIEGSHVGITSSSVLAWALQTCCVKPSQGEGKSATMVTKHCGLGASVVRSEEPSAIDSKWTGQGLATILAKRSVAVRLLATLERSREHSSVAEWPRRCATGRSCWGILFVTGRSRRLLQDHRQPATNRLQTTNDVWRVAVPLTWTHL